MILILLPAYNEEISSFFNEEIRNVLQEVTRITNLVCNDGSTDNTSEILTEYSKEFPLVVIDHTINRGLEVSRDLFELAVEIGNDGGVIIRRLRRHSRTKVYS